MIDPPNPHFLVEALRTLINISDKAQGPDEEVALSTISHLAPVEWILAILKGWQAYAKRYKRPKSPELSRHTPVRFLQPRMLPKLNLDGSNKPCRLCGTSTYPPARKWHKECYMALKPHTSRGWKEIIDQALADCNHKCQSCLVSVKSTEKKKRGKKRRKLYDLDHVIPICLGGKHELENLQILCIACHKVKTKQDMKALRELDSNEKTDK